jgi:hypothetical protein
LTLIPDFTAAHPSYLLYCCDAGAFVMSDRPTSPSGRSITLAKESAKRKRVKQRAFQPFAIQIGWIAYEWNRLQEALGELFSDIVQPDTKRIGYAIWHSTDNDRTLRNILKEAMEASKIENTIEQRPYDDISWILSQIDKLAGRRNTAIHAPFAMISTSSSDLGIEIVPWHHVGHPRARELKNKSLPDEFRWYRDHLEKLADFAEALHWALIFPDIMWPDRPQLAPRGQFESRISPHHKNKPK